METIKTVWMNVLNHQVVIRWDEFDYELNEMITVYEFENAEPYYLIQYRFTEATKGTFSEAFIETHYFLGEF